MEELLERTARLSRDVSALELTLDGYVYNPLEYAWETHADFLSRYVRRGCRALFLGMNPGPFGMMQTGVPFGEVNAVRDWLGIFGLVGHPAKEHPNRPVEGMAISRSEVSGKRFWGLMREHYGTADAFAKECCVFNYCPLGFLDSGKTAKNITPDKLPKDERKALEDICDAYLSDVIEMLDPQLLIGVGKYAMEKLAAVSGGRTVSSIIHPSPGNPQANNGWSEKTTARLKELGLWL